MMVILSCGHVAESGDGPHGMGWPVWRAETVYDFDGEGEAIVYSYYCTACRDAGVQDGWLHDDVPDVEQEDRHA